MLLLALASAAFYQSSMSRRRSGRAAASNKRYTTEALYQDIDFGSNDEADSGSDGNAERGKSKSPDKQHEPGTAEKVDVEMDDSEGSVFAISEDDNDGKNKKEQASESSDGEDDLEVINTSSSDHEPAAEDADDSDVVDFGIPEPATVLRDLPAATLGGKPVRNVQYINSGASTKAARILKKPNTTGKSDTKSRGSRTYRPGGEDFAQTTKEKRAFTAGNRMPNHEQAYGMLYSQPSLVLTEPFNSSVHSSKGKERQTDQDSTLR